MLFSYLFINQFITLRSPNFIITCIFFLQSSQITDVPYDGNMPKTLGSVLRNEIFFSMQKKISNTKDVHSDSEIMRREHMKETLNWNSASSLERSTKFILCSLNKLLQSRSNASISLLSEILKDIVSGWDKLATEQSDADAFVLHSGGVFQMILDSSIIKDLFLRKVQPQVFNALIDVLGVAMKYKRTHSTNLLLSISEKVSSDVFTLADVNESTHSDFFDKLEKLENLALHTDKDDYHKLLLGMLAKAADFLMSFWEKLTNDEENAVEVHLLKCLLSLCKRDYYFINPLSFTQEMNKNNGSTERFGILSRTVSVLLSRFESQNVSALEDLILLLLKADSSCSVCASGNVADACLRYQSTTSLDILKIIVQNSPYHAFIMCKKLTEKSGSFPLRALIHISHSLLLLCYSEDKKKIGNVS